jgi:acyl-CoA synthetase (AMP-forming)/AMP-acid ligase II
MTVDQQLHHIAIYAKETPNRPAFVMGTTGDMISYSELDGRSRKLARYLNERGIVPGDHLAIMMDNNEDYFVVCWAAQRLGLIYTPINWHLVASEVAYIVQNCEAKILVVSEEVRHLAEAISQDIPGVSVALTHGPAFGRFHNLGEVIERTSDGSDIDLLEGECMFYSSGTTGRPKGIFKMDRGQLSWGQQPPITQFLRSFYGFDRDTVYLVPAPLYHAAGLAWSMNVLRAGGTVVVVNKFDSLETLRLIETYRVTHAQFVPTMFVRMLRLPEAERTQYDISSLKVVIHAAAPCAPEIKRKMIEWLGPIVYEYYAGSEASGLTAVDTPTWLSHPGTVGRPVFGQVHIVGEDGEELPGGEVGTIYFSGGGRYVYFNDPEKTASSHNARGWSTLGDIGYVDADGFLYLSDRRTDLILSGGVNIYPREIEDALIEHPSVLDVAVIGVPNPEFGHDVKAVVELRAGIKESDELGTEMIDFCRARIASYKCPKTVDFAILPRLPNGKMLKRELRERYLKTAGAGGTPAGS